MIALKILEVDNYLQKIGTDMRTMFRLAKEGKKTENWLNQNFSQRNMDIKKKKKEAVANALARKRYSTTKQRQETF